jgi:hypothetical protein
MRFGISLRTALLLLALAVIVLIPRNTPAQSLDVDWKYFGGSTASGPEIIWFYDSVGVVREANAHIDVWTKGLLQPELKRIQKSKIEDKQFIDRVASKIVSGYVLPYASVTQVDRSEKITLMTLEDIADSAAISPKMRVLFELDCSGRLFRRLSISMPREAKPVSLDTPGDWEHVPPETNIAALFKILCARS